MKKLRLFFAIDIPDEVRKNLAKAIFELKKTSLISKISWVKLENIHLTLKFLGEVDETMSQNIIASAEKIIVSKPIELSYTGLGAFPNMKAPRIIWANAENNDGTLNQIVNLLEENLYKTGFKKEKRRFSPHLTLGRVRNRINSEIFFQKINEFKLVQFGLDYVNKFYLVKSNLTPEGSTYTKLKEFNILKGV